MPDPIEGLSHVQEDTPAVLSSLKGGGDSVHEAEALLHCGVGGPKTKLVGRNYALGIEYWEESFYKDFLKYF